VIRYEVAGLVGRVHDPGRRAGGATRHCSASFRCFERRTFILTSCLPANYRLSDCQIQRRIETIQPIERGHGMLTRLCIAAMVVVVICGAAGAQSIMLEKDQQGPFFQFEYLWLEGRSPNSFEADFGYAFNSRFEVGAGIALSTERDNYSWDSKSKSRTISTGGQFATLYPVKFGRRKVEFLLGLHEAYAKTFAHQEKAWTAFGASLNLKVKLKNEAALVLTSGYQSASSSGRTLHNTLYGVAFIAKHRRVDKLRLFLEVATGDGPNSYVIGVGHTWVWRRS